MNPTRDWVATLRICRYGPYFAIANASDERHTTASTIWRALSDASRPVVTSNHVVAEFHALMVRTFGQRVALDALDRLAFGARIILYVSDADQAAALDLLRRYLDKRYTLVDAMSFVVMQTHGISQAFTFDRHFVQYGFEVLGLSE